MSKLDKKSRRSLALRVVACGIEEDVQSVSFNWEEVQTDKGLKQVLNQKLGKYDDKVAYADCILMKYEKDLSTYNTQLEYCKQALNGKTKIDRENRSNNNRFGFFRKIRLYWYSNSTAGGAAGNRGINHVLSYLHDSTGDLSSYIRYGSQSPECALEVLEALKASHASGNGAHLVLRADFEKCESRVWMRYIKGIGNTDKTKLWSRLDNNSKVFVENIHGKAMSSYLALQESITPNTGSIVASGLAGFFKPSQNVAYINEDIDLSGVVFSGEIEPPVDDKEMNDLVDQMATDLDNP